MITENERLLIETDAKGAELVRIYDKKNGKELLWNGDARFWSRHSPLLFPNVGRNYLDRARYDGVPYTTKQHGFARDSVFALCEQSDSYVKYALASSDATKSVYPYDFELRAYYRLDGSAITVGWEVENKGDRDMAFTIGAHPAFNVGGDYTFDFHGLDKLEYRLLDPQSGTALPELHTLTLTDGRYDFEPSMFDKDALVIDGQIARATLLVDGKPYITVDCPEFISFGIWSKSGAPFVCLEPWQGRCDDLGYQGEISDKAGAVTLSAGASWCKEYRIIAH